MGKSGTRRLVKQAAIGNDCRRIESYNLSMTWKYTIMEPIKGIVNPSSPVSPGPRRTTSFRLSHKESIYSTKLGAWYHYIRTIRIPPAQKTCSTLNAKL